MKKRVVYIILLIASVMSFSCKDYLTVEPKGYIPQNQNFTNADDAITAVYGLYGLMQKCVDQLILAGVVQSDLVVTGPGADSYIAEIAQNRVTAQNPYTDFTNFYRVVCACNNAVEGLAIIYRKDPVNYSLDKYNYNVAEIICIRAWAYLQMVKIWGDVPYVQNTVKNVDEIKDIPSSAGDFILTQVEKEVREIAIPIFLPMTKPATMANAFYTQWNTISVPVLCAELNINLGNYTRADEYLRFFVPFGVGDGVQFRLIDAINGRNTGSLNWIQQFPMSSGYGWSYLEAMCIDFDGTKGQKNNLMRWTNNKDGGIYAIKPSAIACKNWDAQSYIGWPKKLNGVNLDEYAIFDITGKPLINNTQDSVKGDPRGRGASYWLRDKKDTLISKYLLSQFQTFKNAQINNIDSRDDATFYIYRGSGMLLDVAECWNNEGLTESALYPINGVNTSWSNRGVGGVRLEAMVFPLQFDENKGDKYHQMEQFILDERGLELAYEGRRWFDLVRFAKRHNDPSILAKAVAKKYPASQQAAIIARLSNKDNWYWPYYYKNVAANKLLVQKLGY